jgi:hypothetical protein
MFFPEDINVTKKGINIPWHKFFNSLNSNKASLSASKAKKTISKRKNATQLKQNFKANATSFLKDVELGKESNKLPEHFSQPAISESANLFPELIFETLDTSNSIAPESSEQNPDSFDHFLQNIFPKTISAQQNDLLQKTIDIVGLDQPSSKICSTLPILELSENSGNLFSLTSQHATNQAAAFVPKKSCPLQQKKISAAIDQLSDSIIRFQKNLNTEFNKFQNDLKNIAKTLETL